LRAPVTGEKSGRAPGKRIGVAKSELEAARGTGPLPSFQVEGDGRDGE